MEFKTFFKKHKKVCLHDLKCNFMAKLDRVNTGSYLDCKQSLSFPHNKSNLEVRAAKLQAKTV